MRLNKTQYLAGLQCPRRLYLLVHHPEKANPTVTAAQITGEVVQQHARATFKDAKLVVRNQGVDPLSETRRLLADKKTTAVLEGGLATDRLAVFVDVLERRDSTWELTEIKAGTRVEGHHIDDVGFQAYVADQTGLALGRIGLMHINKDFVYRGGEDYHGLFVSEDLTAQVDGHLWTVPGNIARFEAMLAGPEPDVHIGGHCNRPHGCEFKGYCRNKDADYPVADLPRGHKLYPLLMAREIYDIRDIPADLLTSETHLRVRRITRDGKPELLPQAATELQALAYPRYYLDFECIQFAIPIWPGTRPYQQLPFQWSCHTQEETGALAHREFLDVSGDDPRPVFAKSLLAACGDRGPIVVYNQAFEKRIIRELAAALPEWADALLALNDRIYDLMDVTRRCYYHPAMQGSWSIKSVLPNLVPELSYDDIGSVRDGTQAQIAYFDLLQNRHDTQYVAKLVDDLKQYCKLDTLAMVAIADRLSSV